MKKQPSMAGMTNVQYNANARRKNYYESFNKKNTIIRVIEIVALCVMVITVAAGLYDVYNK